jgi:hypothetical protein
VQPGERHFGGATSVISLSGCYFRAADTFLPGMVLRLKIQWHGTSLGTWARVAHAVSGDGMGLAFLRTDDSQNEILKQWLQELASARRTIS